MLFERRTAVVAVSRHQRVRQDIRGSPYVNPSDVYSGSPSGLAARLMRLQPPAVIQSMSAVTVARA